MTRLLVTGAAGFIGSHLAEALVARGDEVEGIDNFDPFYPRAVKERNLHALRASGRFRLHDANILDTGVVARAAEGCEVLVHLAAKAGVRPSIQDPAGYAETNVAGTASVLAAAQRAGITRVVFGSSSSVYGDATPVPFREDAAAVDPVSPYAATKRAGELLLQALAPLWGFRAAALRFFTVYGPRQRPDLAIHTFARRMAAGEPITLFGDVAGGRDYTYCDDIVAGVLAAIDWTRTAPVGVMTFNLGSNRAIPLRDLVDTLASALGTRPTVVYAPPAPGDVRMTCADLSRSRAVLGYEPRVAFADGIARFVEWFNETHER
ncbi:MAG: NAD-dependent epimerase/dehydratase family protein [Gemmatimonadota bacterium]